MITTLTPNPSLDRTVSLPGELIRGGVNRLTGVTIEPGGKGLNVARVLVGAGRVVTAVLPAASHDPLLRVLGAVAADGLRVRPVDVAGSARINTAVTEPDGTTTKLNEPGAGLDDDEIAAVERAAQSQNNPRRHDRKTDCLQSKSMHFSYCPEFDLKKHTFYSLKTTIQ